MDFILNKFMVSPEIISKIEATFSWQAKSVKTKPCRIKFNGRFVVLASKKTIWRNVGFAKNALSAHLQSFTSAHGWKYYQCKDLRKELEDQGVVEYVEAEIEEFAGQKK